MDDQNEHELLLELVQAAGTMCTVVDNAAVNLSEELDTMVRPQIEAVRAVLARCPTPQEWIWDGELRPEDLNVEMFRAEGQSVRDDAKGVKITHIPTGISGESYSKASQLENREAVMKYLRRAVGKQMGDQVPS